MSANTNRAFQLALTGAVPELTAMLSSSEVGPDAVRQDGMYRGWSLLHAAASKGQAGVADVLLRAGASARATNAAGKTAAQMAAEKGHAGLASHLHAAESGAAVAMAPQVIAAAPPPARMAPPQPVAQPPPPQPVAQAPAPRSGGPAGFWIAESSMSEAPMEAQVYHQPPPPQPAAAPPQTYAAAVAGTPMPQTFQQPFIPPPVQQQISPHQQAFSPPPPQAFAPPPQPQPQQTFAPPPQPPRQPPPQLQPAAPMMSFGAPPTPSAAAPPPTAQSPATPTGVSDAAAAAVESVLNAHADKVGGGAYLAVIPASSLPKLIGEQQVVINEMCARLGAQVDIGQEESNGQQLAWVKTSAASAKAAEAMIWEVVSVVPDGEACGAGFPLPTSAQSSIDATFVDAAKRASQARAIVHAPSQNLVLLSATTASLHTALLLLLRDGLASEASSHKEALAFTAYPQAIEAIREAAAALPADQQHRARLMLPSASPGGAPDGPRWAFLATDRGYLEQAGSLVVSALGLGGGATPALQSLHGARVCLDGGAKSRPAAPLLPAAFGGGASSDAEHTLAMQLVAGTELGKVAPMLAAVDGGRLSVATARRLRAACMAHMRARLSEGGGRSEALVGTLMWLDGATAMIDARVVGGEADGSKSGKRPADASGSGQAVVLIGSESAAKVAKSSEPVLSFGGGGGKTVSREPSAGATSSEATSAASAAASAAAAAISARITSGTAAKPSAAEELPDFDKVVGGGGEGGSASAAVDSSSSYSSESESEDSEERRKRKRKKREKKEKREKRKHEKKDKDKRRRKSEA